MAILGIILIVLMYAATFIAAVFVKKYTVRLFLASMIMTMVVPLLLYAYQMTMKIFLHLNVRIRNCRRTIKRDLQRQQI